MAEVLVTGGAGFIGSHLVDALVDQGNTVRVVDALLPQVHPTRPTYLNPRAEYRFGDIREPGFLAESLKDVQTVYHLAAAVGVGQSMYQIRHYVDVNTAGTAALLQILADGSHSVQRLVVASSMSIYGEGAYDCPTCGRVHPALRTAEQLSQGLWEMTCPVCHGPVTAVPTPEDKPVRPTSIYAITKRDQEEMSLVTGKAYGIPTVALRFFNVYGPRQTLSNPYTGVCAIFQSRIQNGQPPMVFEDGLQTRDFISVHDIVEGLKLAGERSAADYHALNLGTGQATSVLAIAELLCRLYGKDLHPSVSHQFRAGDIRHCVADVGKARDLLGFRPSVPLEQGLREFIEWSRSSPAEDRSGRALQELKDRGLVGGSR
jgi:dTDP-L-rhamnose 4-epimerase